MTVREFIEQLRAKGLGLYEAMDKLDNQASLCGYDSPAFYSILCDVYIDWKYEEKRKRKCRLASKLSSEEWLLLQQRYDYRCFYCGKQVEKLTKDHIIPLIRNGTDTTNNIVPACKRCNSRKNSRPIETFKEGATLKLI